MEKKTPGFCPWISSLDPEPCWFKLICSPFYLGCGWTRRATKQPGMLSRKPYRNVIDKAGDHSHIFCIIKSFISFILFSWVVSHAHLQFFVIFYRFFPLSFHHSFFVWADTYNLLFLFKFFYLHLVEWYSKFTFYSMATLVIDSHWFISPPPPPLSNAECT